MKKIAVSIGLALLLATSNVFAWSEPGATFKVLGKHIEVQSGSPRFITYFIATNKVVALYNLDRPDVQLIQKELDSAYQSGKTLYYLNNGTRGARTAMWYDLDNRGVSVTFLDIYSGDSAYFRAK